jgi:CDP-diacylglycerol--serine O-phosphatidyltransferase
MTQDGARRRGGRRLARGIHVMPALFTLGNLFCGASSVLFAAEGQLRWAGAMILGAAILDGLDGRLARLTGATTRFGLEFDSMADMVSFGLAPAFAAWVWALRPLGRFGWLVAVLYVICTATRLARFNVGAAPTVLDKRHFAGLPSPMAGLVAGTLVFAFPDALLALWLRVVVGIALLAVAALMVSRFRYRSFKELDLRSRRSYRFVLPAAAVLVLVAVQPEATLLTLAVLYLLSGPAGWVASMLRHKRGGAAPRVESRTDEPAYD